MTQPRVWLITGSSSGFGRSMTERVLGNGDIAVATLRKPEVLSDLESRYGRDKLLVLKLDVQDEKAVNSVFKKAQDTYGRIDVVFSNAGTGTVGELEGSPTDASRQIFDVNFWGGLYVAKAALAAFRENKPKIGGRLLAVSDVGGVQSKPGEGIYSASKFALEGAIECLSKELDPKWNIKLTLIEPGFFRTSGIANVGSWPEHPAYTDPSLPSIAVRKYLAEAQTQIDGDPDKATRAMYELSALPDPPLRLVLGKDAIQGVRDKAKSLIADVDAYESWSDNLKFD